MRLPKEDVFKGITVCLRAITGNSICDEHAIVEFSDPKMEMGSFCTNN